MTRPVFVLRPLTKKEQKKVSILHSAGAKVYMLAHIQMHIDAKPIKPLEESKIQQINKDSIESLETFYQKLTEVGFNSDYYFLNRFRAYFDLRNALYLWEQLRPWHEKIEQASFYCDNGLLSERIKKVGGEAIVPNQLNLISKFQFLLASAIRLVISLFNRHNPKNKVLLVDSREYYQKMLSKEGQSIDIENVPLGYIFQEFTKAESVHLDRFNPPKRVQRGLTFSIRHLTRNFKNRNRLYEEKILFLFFLKAVSVKRLKEKTAIDFEKISGIDDDSITYFLKLAFRGYMESTAFFLWKQAAYEHYFSKNRPSLVLLTDEYSPNLRIISVASQTLSIPVVAVQHGSIHDLHPGYVYSNQEIAESFVLPTILLVWGDRWRNFLLEVGGWPEDRVLTMGHIRTDVIPMLLSDNSSEPSFTLSNDSSKKRVLFATQPLKDQSLRARIALDVLQACKEVKDITLFVKLHPHEKDLDLWSDWLSKSGNKNCHILPELDLYSTLSEIDIVLTASSTVGAEAIYFKKPLVIIDHFGEDILRYYHDNVAFRAHDQKSLSAILQKVVDGETMPQKYLDQYIMDNVKIINGKTSASYKKVIDRISKGLSPT